MGGKTISTSAEKIANIQLQTSSYGGVIAKVYGTNRVAGNLIWYGNFKPTAHTTTTSAGGKGMGKTTQKDTTYTYAAAVAMALCEGPISGVGSVWKGKDQTTLAALGLTLFTGTETQSVWSFLSGYNVSGNWNYETAYGYTNYALGYSPAFTDQALSYSSTAYLASAAYDLGTDASIPNHGFEIRGSHIFGGAIQDANPADIVPDMLGSTQYGAAFPLSMLGALTGAAGYSNYCVANGIFVSPAYIDQAPTADRIKELTDMTNAAPVWSGGLLKIVPYGDKTVTGNGVTYTPNLAPLYDLTDDDFLVNGDEDPIIPVRKSTADAMNRVQLEFCNRANQYNVELVSAEDQNATETFNLKTDSPFSAHMICDSAVAKFVVQLQLQRALYQRNEFAFTLNARYPMLEPMDIVTLTDSILGMNRLPVRLLEVTEVDDGFACVAEQLLIGVAQPAQYAHDNGLRWQATIGATPQSVAVPAFFELPPDANSLTGLAIGIAVGGQAGDNIFGGCRVWASVDGLTYKVVGIVYGQARYGTLTATLAAGSGLDTTHTLAVSLRSGGQLLSGSSTDALNASTLLAVEQEFLSYTTATLTGASAYDLTNLQRGQYLTTGVSHASGALWARIDDAICQLQNMDLSLIGKTLYFKFTAFNTYGSGEQDLSVATAYTYIPSGYAQRLGKLASISTGATQNTWSSGSTAPPSPVLWQEWTDTSGGGAVLKVWTGAAWARKANDSVPSITATISSSALTSSGSAGSNPGNLTSASTTVTPAGGSTYTYAWGWVSGDTFTVNSPTAATTTFTKSCAYGQTYSGVYRCTITSTSGATAGATATVDVAISITETHVVGGGISASFSPSALYGAAYITSNPQSIGTGNVTVTASGGATYSYAWSYYDGDSVSISSPSSATTSVSKSCHYGDSFSGNIQCLVTSLSGATAGQTAIVIVPWSISETH